MKSLLYITYEFPPKGGSGVQRAVKFAKYLPRFGWRPTVLTVKDPPTALLDDSLTTEVADVPTVRAYSLEPMRLWAWRRRLSDGGRRPRGEGAQGPIEARRGSTGLPTGFIRFIQSLFVPDDRIGWKPWAVRAARKAIRAEGATVVLASAPPFSTLLIARSSARREGVPWVADFRDPWIGHHYYREGPTSLHRALTRRLERRVVTDAAAVVSASDSTTRAFKGRYPEIADKFVTITNGFDPDDFPSAVRPSDRFLVVYAGSFYEERNPVSFLSAASELAAEDADFDRDLAVEFIGPMDGETAALVASSPLAARIVAPGYVPHEQALARMRAARVLLFVTDPQEGTKHLAAKIFEYLGAGRPILALTGEGEAREIVRRLGAGIVARPDDISAVKDALRRLYSDYQQGGAEYAPDQSGVAHYDRAALTGRLGALLDEVTKGVRRG